MSNKRDSTIEEHYGVFGFHNWLKSRFDQLHRREGGFKRHSLYCTKEGGISLSIIKYNLEIQRIDGKIQRIDRKNISALKMRNNFGTI